MTAFYFSGDIKAVTKDRLEQHLMASLLLPKFRSIVRTPNPDSIRIPFFINSLPIIISDITQPSGSTDFNTESTLKASTLTVISLSQEILG